MSHSDIDPDPFLTLIHEAATAKAPAEAMAKMREALDMAFGDCTKGGWRSAMDEVRGVLQRVMDAGHGQGVPPRDVAINVADLLMVVEALREEGPSKAAVSVHRHGRDS